MSSEKNWIDDREPALSMGRWRLFFDLPYFDWSELRGHDGSAIINRFVSSRQFPFSLDCRLELVRYWDALLGIVVRGQDMAPPQLMLSHASMEIGKFELLSKGVWVWKSSAPLPIRHLTHTRIHLELKRERLTARCVTRAENIPEWLKLDIDYNSTRTCEVTWLGCDFFSEAIFLNRDLARCIINDVYPLKIYWGVANFDPTQKPRQLRDWSTYLFHNESNKKTSDIQYAMFPMIFLNTDLPCLAMKPLSQIHQSLEEPKDL